MSALRRIADGRRLLFRGLRIERLLSPKPAAQRQCCVDRLKSQPKADISRLPDLQFAPYCLSYSPFGEGRMILRILADAIKEQNWSTVILEILIVVVGIFIGLQVDGWNEGRKKQQDIEVQLLRIADDAAVLIAHTDRVIVDFDNRIARAQIALAILDGTPLTEANTPAFELALEESFQLNEVEVDLPGLNILINTGDIDQVADADARDAMLALTNKWRSRKTVIEHIRSLLDIVNRDIFRGISFDIVGLDAERDSGAEFDIRYDLDRLRADPGLRAALSNAALMQGYGRSQTVIARAALKAVVDSLEQRTTP
jgi:hypothetical protein